MMNFRTGGLHLGAILAMVAAETAEEYHKRLGALFQQKFDNQANPYESDAWWVGASHPTHGDVFWVMGNSSDTNEMSPPDTPATLDDHFYIGSISKSFGATVNLLLIERGDFALDDTVSTLVPDLTADFPQYANFTVKELMGMQTDIPDFLNDPEGFMKSIVANPTLRHTIPEIVEFAMQKYPDEAAPNYSTTNILVLEYIAEAITGMGMPELVDSLVASKLGLPNTAEPPRDSVEKPALPAPAVESYAGQGCRDEYVGSGGQIEVDDPLNNFTDAIVQFGTGGGMYSTIGDLLQWAKTGLGDSLLSPEHVAERHIFRPIYYGTTQYGLGIHTSRDFFLSTDPHPSTEGWYGHDGDAFGSDTRAFRNDELNAAYASVLNTCAYGGLQKEAFNIIVGDLLETETPGTEPPTDAPEVSAPTAAGGDPPTKEPVSSPSPSPSAGVITATSTVAAFIGIVVSLASAFSL